MIEHDDQDQDNPEPQAEPDNPPPTIIRISGPIGKPGKT